MGKLLHSKRHFFFILLLAFSLYSLIILITFINRGHTDDSLVLLAKQFLHGHISLEPTVDMPLGDISLFHGKYYVYFAPLSSIILMPFVAIFGKHFPQIAIGISSLIISFFAINDIAKSFKFTTIDSLWLSLFFTFSTVLLGVSVINISAYQVQAMGAALVLLSLYEYFVKKRLFLAGVYLGLAVMTRNVLIVGSLFFIFEFIQKRITTKQLVAFLIPVVISCSLLGVYNFVRFHSFFESGYLYATSLRTYPLSKNLEYGYMSLAHVPANLYSLLIMPPDPLTYSQHGFVLKFPYLKANPWGMAIWFTSPLLLLLFTYPKKGTYTISALATTACLAIPLLLYYSVGFAQYGYRYALDFLPFLFIVLLPSLSSQLSKKALVLISIGVIYNAVYITSLWGIYPVIGIYH